MIARASLADGVAVDLWRQIQRSGFAGSDRISTESELVTRYGVSRKVIRDGLSRMAELPGRVDADRAFHVGLAVATRNSLYARCRVGERLGLMDVAMPTLQPRAAAHAAPLPEPPRRATTTGKARPPAVPERRRPTPGRGSP